MRSLRFCAVTITSSSCPGVTSSDVFPRDWASFETVPAAICSAAGFAFAASTDNTHAIMHSAPNLGKFMTTPIFFLKWSARQCAGLLVLNAGAMPDEDRFLDNLNRQEPIIHNPVQ